jgi:hypothetical protein
MTLNTSRPLKGFTRHKSVVPLALKFIALHAELQELWVGYREAGLVEVLIP